MYITITGMSHYLGLDVFRINQLLILEVEPDNSIDNEAIKVSIEGGAMVGYVANSVYTIVKGTHSAGYIYRDIKDKVYAKVNFITHESVIAELMLNNEIEM